MVTLMVSNGADALLRDVLDRSIKNTGETFREVTEGTCPAHPGLHRNVEEIRTGVHALLLCRKEELDHPATSATQYTTIGFGPFKIKTNATNADWIFRLSVVVIGMMVLGYVIVQISKIKADVRSGYRECQSSSDVHVDQRRAI